MFLPLQPVKDNMTEMSNKSVREKEENSNCHIQKQEMCPQYTNAPAVGYLTIKLQNSTWCKCLNLNLTGSRTYTHWYRRTYFRTHVQKTEKLYAPGII